MKWVILNEHELTELTKPSRNLSNGQFLVRVNKLNSDILKAYKKYTKDELKSINLDETPEITNTKFNPEVLSPFAAKKLPDERKLYRRKRGTRNTIPANSSASITFTVPYAMCKIDQLEITNTDTLDQADFNVRDTATGTYSGYPNVVIEQFGFDVEMPMDFYVDRSNYDANLYGGMVLEVVYKNSTSNDKIIGINFNLHEIK